MGPNGNVESCSWPQLSEILSLTMKMVIMIIWCWVSKFSSHLSLFYIGRTEHSCKLEKEASINVILNSKGEVFWFHLIPLLTLFLKKVKSYNFLLGKLFSLMFYHRTWKVCQFKELLVLYKVFFWPLLDVMNDF